MGNRNRVPGWAALCVGALAAAAPATGQAGEVTLRSADGSVNLVGEFIDFRDDFYVIRTTLGELRVAASRVRCEGADCPNFETADADIAITGSDTIGNGLMPLLMSGYAGYLNAEPTITNTAVSGQFLAAFVGDGGFGDEIATFLVSSTDAADAFRSLQDGNASIAMAERRIRPDEARALRDAGAGNLVSAAQEHVLAVDSLVVVVHPDNPVDSITLQDLRRIYSGEYTNWSQIGGPDRPIKVIARTPDSPSTEVFNSRVFGDQVPPLPEGVLRVAENEAVAGEVNADPNAISFVGYAFQRGAKPLVLANECGITVEPDSFAAKTEEYALQRRLYLYTRQDVDQATLDFIAFTRAREADGVIAKAGFVDLGIERKTQPMDGERATALLNSRVDAFEGNAIREFLAQMVQFDRLSTTFRFRLGSSALDERAFIDMERLTAYLEDMPEGTSVAMVGFTDDIGAFEANQRLSLERAQSVADELRAFAGDRLAPIRLTTFGFGEIAPSACNDSEIGRGINRRVEVWIDKNAG